MQAGLRARTSRVMVAVLAGLLAVAPAHLAAQPLDERARAVAYDDAIGAAVDAFEAQRWEEADRQFQRAHVLLPSARTLRGLGLVALQRGRLVEARRLFDAALADARRPLTPVQRDEAHEALVAIDVEVGRYLPRLDPADAQLTLDGEAALLESDGRITLAPGVHALRVTAPACAPHQQQLDVRAGERRELAITLAPTPAIAVPPRSERAPVRVAMPTPRAPGRIAAWATLGSSGAIAGVGASLLALGLRDLSKVEDAADGTPWSQLKGPNARAPVFTGMGIAAIALGAGGVGVGAWLLHRTRRADRAPVRVSLSPLGASLRGAF